MVFDLRVGGGLFLYLVQSLEAPGSRTTSLKLARFLGARTAARRFWLRGECRRRACTSCPPERGSALAERYRSDESIQSQECGVGASGE